MKSKKLYFSTLDDTFCTTLEEHIDVAKFNGLTEITLIEAVPDNETKDYIWCGLHNEAGDRSECTKYSCEGYSKKGGRGVCEHRGNLFLHGNKVTFKVE